MRVLFVDDEPRVLDGLANLLFDIGHDEDGCSWEWVFAASGAEALALLEEQAVDVIVTDMRMPGMDGHELLSRVRDRHPEIVRIVLSGQTDAEVAELTLPIVHEFLSKPCEPDLLVATINEAGRVARGRCSPALRAMLGGLPGLPARPGLYLELRALVDREAPLGEVAEVIQGDPGVHAHVLRIANSAFYGRRTRVATVADAVRRVGLRSVTGIVLVADGLRGFGSVGDAEIERIGRDALAVHALVEPLPIEPALAPTRDLACFLHDLGELVLLSAAPAGYADVLVRMAAEGRPRTEVEREVLGVDHATAGAHLMRLWHLDPLGAEIVERHHDPFADADEVASPLAAQVAAAEIVLGVPGYAPTVPVAVAPQIEQILRARRGAGRDPEPVLD